MRRPVLVQLGLFLLVAVVSVGYGTRYVLGPQALRGGIEVTAHATDGLGLTPGTAVTYRGVAVGTVSAVTVSEDGSGADVSLSLDPGTQVPLGSTARSSTASALGIQSLDILPTTTEGPYLTDGDRLELRPQDQPKQLADLLVAASQLSTSIKPDTVSSLADTLATSLDGAGPELQQLIDGAATLSTMLQARVPALENLVRSGLPLLHTLARGSTALPATASATRNVAEQLVAHEPTLVYLLDRSPEALARVQVLLDATRGDVGSLLGNLVTVTGVLGARTPALDAALVSLPVTLAQLTGIVQGDRGRFTLVATQGPACYYDTQRRMVGDLSPREPNLALYCPPGENLEQRGSASAPRPNGEGAASATVPGKVIGPPLVDDPVMIPPLLEGVPDGNP